MTAAEESLRGTLRAEVLELEQRVQELESEMARTRKDGPPLTMSEADTNSRLGGRRTIEVVYLEWLRGKRRLRELRAALHAVQER